MAGAPQTVGHPSFRVFKRSRADANRGLNAILVALRLGRYELNRLPRSQENTLLGAYYEHDIADIGDFNYRVSHAKDYLSVAEADLAYMAVPYATSLYEDYISDLARLAARDGHGNVPRRAGAVALHRYLANAGITLPQKEALLFESVRTIRNCIVHAAGIADAEAESASVALRADPHAAASWERITKGQPAEITSGNRIAIAG
jgi:hypothetical protein